MALFFCRAAASKPSDLATPCNNFLSPFPSVMSPKGTLLMNSHSLTKRKGYLVSLPLLLMALSSLPRFLTHSLPISKRISPSMASYPALSYATLYLEYPANSSSAPSPLITTLVCAASLAMWRAAPMLKSMWVVLGYSMRRRVGARAVTCWRLLCIWVQWYILWGLRCLSQAREDYPLCLSGASALKERLMRWIYWLGGKTISSRRAIIDESIPPENITLQCCPASTKCAVNSFILSNSSLVHV